MGLRGEAVIAEGVSKLYSNGVWGIRGVSFKAGYGELLVLLGPNGSGKTTTINVLTTLIKPTSGRAIVAGYDVVREARMARRFIALMPQDAAPDPNWTPLEAVKWYLVARGLSLGDAEREARLWLEKLGLWDVRGRSGWELSGGQRRRILAAMVLASGAPIVFLDEPTAGIDVEGKYVIWSSLREAVRDGRCIVYTTHDMREAERIGDVIVMLKNGVIVASGTPVELVERLPFKYKVVVESGNARCDNTVFKVNFAGSTILYFRSRGEALTCIAELAGVRATLEEVSLEDAYIHNVHGG